MTLLEFLHDPNNQGYILVMTIAIFIGIYAVVRAFRR